MRAKLSDSVEELAKIKTELEETKGALGFCLVRFEECGVWKYHVIKELQAIDRTIDKKCDY